VAFRKVFGAESHQKAICSFLNAVMELKEDEKVAYAQLLDRSQVPEIESAYTRCLFKSLILWIHGQSAKDLWKKLGYFFKNTLLLYGLCVVWILSHNLFKAIFYKKRS